MAPRWSKEEKSPSEENYFRRLPRSCSSYRDKDWELFAENDYKVFEVTAEFGRRINIWSEKIKRL